LQNEYLFSYSNVLVYIFLILLLGAILILVRHIPNIKKLMNGIENKAFSKK
jgi:glycerol-3-phosphate acyltransferase PlsY